MSKNKKTNMIRELKKESQPIIVEESKKEEEIVDKSWYTYFVSYFK